MIKRLFRVLYVITISSLCLFFIIYPIVTIKFNKITTKSYRAKCLFNNQYVVLEGAKYNEAYTFNEDELKELSLYGPTTKKNLNFYCKYYEDIQPYIIGYLNSNSYSEQVTINEKFFKFKDSVSSKISGHPPLYELEDAGETKNWNELFNPIIESIIITLIIFVLLQILRISYIYIVFGEIVWHPFKERHLKKIK